MSVESTKASDATAGASATADAHGPTAAVTANGGDATKSDDAKDQATASTPADAADGPATNTQSSNDKHEDDKAKNKTAPSTPPADKAASNGGTAASGTADSSSKKSNKRRSSAGVPEHKSKKLNRKKSVPVLQLSCTPGEYYWARLKGHPPWPAIICDDEMLPEALLSNRPVSTKRPDGSYREDYADGGKNVKDRTYPVMYLFTNEFSWMPNHELSPLDIDELKEKKSNKLPKKLFHAYEIAEEQHDLPYFKNMLEEHVKAIEEDQRLRAEEAARKQASKDKKAAKRKSKPAVDEDGDSAMEDASTEESSKKTSKKRKQADDGDGEGTETPAKVRKLTLKPKTPGDASANKPKAKPKTPKSSGTKAAAKPAKKPAQKPAAPPKTEEELKQDLQRSILFFRHKLQKGFLGESTPDADALKDLSEHMGNLEQHQQLEAHIIKGTRIHKVLRGIIKTTHIPEGDEYGFRTRSQDLLDHWARATGEDMGAPSGAPGKNGEASTDAKDKPKEEASVDSGEKAAAENADEKKEQPLENGEPATEKKEEAEQEDTEMKDADADVPMTDDTADAPETEAPKADLPTEADEREETAPAAEATKTESNTAAEDEEL